MFFDNGELTMHTVALHVPELAENGLPENESELAVRLTSASS
jgi:hypothetical protein